MTSHDPAGPVHKPTREDVRESLGPLEYKQEWAIMRESKPTMDRDEIKLSVLTRREFRELLREELPALLRALRLRGMGPEP